jgi:mono/diheme cytochrome c family protein
MLVDATISGLRRQELEVLDRLLRPNVAAGVADAVAMLAGAAARRGDVAAVQQIVARAVDSTAPVWQRTAVLEGLDTGLAGGAGGRGRGAPGGRGAAAPTRTVSLAAEPRALLELAEGADEAGATAKRVLSKLEWPGKPALVVEVAPLTPDEQRRFDAGAEVYKGVCVGCHQPDGRGKEKVAPSLVESAYVQDPTAGAPIRILLGGKEGPIGLMPPLGGALTDEQVAAVLTYIRREWGHTAAPVAPDDVLEIRGLTKSRSRPWTDAELQQGRGGRPAPAGRGAQQ